MKKFWIVSALLLALGQTAVAQTRWMLDGSHSSLMFEVDHMKIATVEGKFNLYQLQFTSPEVNKFEGATVSATIETKSISTGNDGRDNHLRSDDFFSAEKYPQITFTSKSFRKTGTDTYEIKGDLTIRETTKEVTFTARLTGVMTDQKGKIHAGWRANTTIQRLDYGLKWNQLLETGNAVVSNDVRITFTLELVQD